MGLKWAREAELKTKVLLIFTKFCFTTLRVFSSKVSLEKTIKQI
jgi:hypothetical protein